MPETQAKNFMVCTIRIIVPVESNDEAFRVKEYIDQVFHESKQAKIDFNITTLPKMFNDLKSLQPNGQPEQ